MSEPLAYLLTWRTYGTWLHGDSRGSVDWEHNAYGTPMLAPSRGAAGRAQGRMCHSPVLLNATARELVAAVLVDHWRVRGWELHESAVRHNHVHVVVAYAGLKPEPMMSQFKAYGTRALRGAGVTGPGAPVWAEGGSTRYLWTPEQVNAACAYVREGQQAPR
jgi:REP element-mobilizing transposase RayT